MHEGDNPSFSDEFIEITLFLRINIRIFKQVQNYLKLLGCTCRNPWELAVHQRGLHPGVKM
jgi:hypothetical protein